MNDHSASRPGSKLTSCPEQIFQNPSSVSPHPPPPPTHANLFFILCFSLSTSTLSCKSQTNRNWYWHCAPWDTRRSRERTICSVCFSWKWPPPDTSMNVCLTRSAPPVSWQSGSNSSELSVKKHSSQWREGDYCWREFLWCYSMWRTPMSLWGTAPRRSGGGVAGRGGGRWWHDWDVALKALVLWNNNKSCLRTKCMFLHTVLL